MGEENSPTPFVSGPGVYRLIVSNTANGCADTSLTTVTLSEQAAADAGDGLLQVVGAERLGEAPALQVPLAWIDGAGDVQRQDQREGAFRAGGRGGEDGGGSGGDASTATTTIPDSTNQYDLTINGALGGTGGDGGFGGEASVTVRVIATVLFLLLTAPIAAHMIGRAAARALDRGRPSPID